MNNLSPRCQNKRTTMKNQYWLFIHLSILAALWASSCACIYFGINSHMACFLYLCAVVWPVLMILDGAGMVVNDGLDEMNDSKEGNSDA